MKVISLVLSKYFAVVYVLAQGLIANGQQTNSLNTVVSSAPANGSSTNSLITHPQPSTDRLMLGQKPNEAFPVTRLQEVGFVEKSRGQGLWIKDKIQIGEVSRLLQANSSDFQPLPNGPAVGSRLRYAKFKNGFCVIEGNEWGNTNFVKCTINTNLNFVEKEPRFVREPNRVQAEPLERPDE